MGSAAGTRRASRAFHGRSASRRSRARPTASAASRPRTGARVRLAVIGKPAVVGVAHRGGEAGILDGAGEQAEARIEEGGVDAVGIHVDDARVRVETAFASFGVFQGAGLDDALSGAHGTQATDPPRITQQLAFDAQALLAIVVDDEPRPALAEFGIDVLVPQVEGLEDVAVGVDYVVRARHRQSLRRQSYRCDTTVAATAAPCPSRTWSCHRRRCRTCVRT